LLLPILLTPMVLLSMFSNSIEVMIDNHRFVQFQGCVCLLVIKLKFGLRNDKIRKVDQVKAHDFDQVDRKILTKKS
jgi:hypothetical protein